MLERHYQEKDVYEATLDRFRHIYAMFDTVFVSFSGGKDSTAVLNMAIEVAKELKRGPVHVAFLDEEAQYSTTIDYVRRVSRRPEIKMHWLCLPMKHRNACSRKEPYWYPWDPRCKDKWVREMPEEAITYDMLPGFDPADTHSAINLLVKPEHGQVAMCIGLRAQESMRRENLVRTRKVDNYINPALQGPYKNIQFVYPIYDWKVEDVWTAPQMFDWDYNRTYDYFEAMGCGWGQQRISPPFGEEPLAILGQYAVVEPDLWHRMIERVHGAATAGRYCKSEIYFRKIDKPENMSWKDYTLLLISRHEPSTRAIVSKKVEKLIQQHQKKTDRPVPEDKPDLMSGLSWKFMSQLAMRGDLKGRLAQKTAFNGLQEARKQGIDTLQQIHDIENQTRYVNE